MRPLLCLLCCNDSSADERLPVSAAPVSWPRGLSDAIPKHVYRPPIAAVPHPYFPYVSAFLTLRYAFQLSSTLASRNKSTKQSAVITLRIHIAYVAQSMMKQFRLSATHHSESANQAEQSMRNFDFNVCE